jgi:polyhydroxyalkanoate synthesis repressor PhaR
MNSVRTITKYPNRRLYDTEESRYVTLADIRNLVIRKVDFVVLDRKSGADITRTILLQVISEQEQHGEAVMSRDFLSQVIRSYGKVVPEFASGYLEESMKFFMAGQKSLREQIRKVVDRDPFSAVADVAQKNFASWKALQEEVLQRFASLSRLDDTNSEGIPAEHEKA